MLHNFVSVYVPGTNGLNGDLSPDKQAQYTQETARRLSAEFGGATASAASGYYVSESGVLVEERVIIVKSYHDTTAESALEFVRNIAQWLKNELSQELVSIETESGIEFV